MVVRIDDSCGLRSACTRNVRTECVGDGAALHDAKADGALELFIRA
jgi:hypothetical protein